MNNSIQISDEYLVAGAWSTPPSMLDELSRSQDATIRSRVAENPASHFTTLLRLATDSDRNVRLNLSENESLPIVILMQLAHDQDLDVRYGLAEKSFLPRSVLQLLAKDENPYIAHRAAKTLSRLSIGLLDAVA